MPKDEGSKDDPMELKGVVLPADAETMLFMAECMVEEFVKMGWDEERLMTLFRNPFYQGTHQIYRLKGEEYARNLIRLTRTRWGFGEKRAGKESEDAESL